MYVGTLTADEVIFAGGLVDNYNQNYYLINDYQLNNDLHWWTLSSSEFEDSDDCGYPGESVYVVDNDGVVYSQMLYYPRDVRPAINISGSKDISKGNGTKDNPYVIN